MTTTAPDSMQVSESWWSWSLRWVLAVFRCLVLSLLRMVWAFAGLFLVVFAWFAFMPPSHDRPWCREVVVMPRAIIDDDRVRITGVRNFDYRSETDFTERWEEREVSLADLTLVGLFIFISSWKAGPIGHTFVSIFLQDAQAERRGIGQLCSNVDCGPF